MSHALVEGTKKPASGWYRCRDCGTTVTADVLHPNEACAISNAIRVGLLTAVKDSKDVT